MSDSVSVVYVGTSAAVEFIGEYGLRPAVKGVPVDVSHEVAHGVEGREGSGLLDQPDNWELATVAATPAGSGSSGSSWLSSPAPPVAAPPTSGDTPE